MYNQTNYIHLSRNNNFVPLLKLLVPAKNKVKITHSTLEKVTTSFTEVQRNMHNFFLKRIKEKKDKTTEQEQNISLNLKEM